MDKGEKMGYNENVLREEKMTLRQKVAEMTNSLDEDYLRRSDASIFSSQRTIRSQ